MSIESNSSTGPDRWALSRKWIDRRAWQSPGMRTALAEHDLATVFRVLKRYGVSQRKIAAITDQSQSEISEIMGGRLVRSYDVLVRVADLCRVRHSSAYAECRIMPTRVVRGLVDDAAATELVGISRP